MLLIKVTFPPYFIRAQQEIPKSHNGKGLHCGCQSCFCLIIELMYYKHLATKHFAIRAIAIKLQNGREFNVMVFETDILNERKFKKMG